MNEKDLLNKLSEFKQIKPNHDWVVWLRSNILEKNQLKTIFEKPKITLANFNYKYQKTFIPVLLGLFIITSFGFAQTTLPGNILYPLKTLTQNAKIYLASNDDKPVVHLEVVKSRMEDLSKTQNCESEKIAMVKKINEDLEKVPQEIEKINKKQKVLDVSKNIQEKSKDLNLITEKIILDEKEKQELNQKVLDTQNKVLALIIKTEDEINQCPSFLEENLTELSESLKDLEKIKTLLTPDDIIQTKLLLTEATEAFKAGDCFLAIEKTESIKSILSILSLDVQVETSTPENLVEDSSEIPQEELIEE